MGCCQSDLKGDSPSGTGGGEERIRKVQTNFSTIDYDANAQGRRDTIYGPHETPRQKSDALSPLTEKPSNPLNSVVADTSTPEASATGGDRISAENKLHDTPATVQDPVTRNHEHVEKAPYKDVTESPTSPTTPAGLPPAQVDSAIDPSKQAMGLFSRKKSSEQQTGPAVTKNQGYLNTFENDLADPAPASGKFGFDHDTPADKEQFLTARASNASRSSAGSAGEEKQSKKSLYQKYKDLKRGPGTAGVSDEEFQKATGMTREEHAQWAKTANGVAGNQAAGSITAGGTSGIGLAGGAGEGLGGYGWEAGKDPVVR